MVVFTIDAISDFYASRGARRDRSDVCRPIASPPGRRKTPPPGTSKPLRRKGLVMHPAHRIRISSPARRRDSRAAALRRAAHAALEPLESRWLCSVTASAANGVLTVLGDDNANAITVSRNAAGNLF